jgi:hypothetical protein
MKSMVLMLSLMALSSTAMAQSVHVFGVGIEVREDCVAAISHQDSREVLKMPFSEAGRCQLLSNSETDIPRIEFIQGEYVLLVESRQTVDGACRANLVALVIPRDGKLRLSKPTQSSSACGSAERKDYEILHFATRG